MLTSAEFSPCRTWRYSLERIWEPSLALCQFIGLNPSTANETKNDPTIRRCITFAQDWGYGGLVMSNLFAFRATNPLVMKQAPDPIGPENNDWLRRDHNRSTITVAAWGVHGAYWDRGLTVAAFLKLGLLHLGKTKDGHPRHPLYLKRSEHRRLWHQE